MRASMTSPPLPEFHPACLKVVSRRNLGPVRLPISYRRSLTPAIRVSLISFFGIPYFSGNGGKQMALREKSAPPCRWPEAWS
jgi:hypothetical protein